MSKIWLISLASILTIASVITPAFAASVHFIGDHSLPSFTDNTVTPNPLTLTASGAISGLGFGDLNITITSTAQPTATCGNPGSKQTQAPGQNPAVVSVSGSQAIPASEVKNGNVAFSVATSPPTTGGPVPSGTISCTVTP